MDKPPPAQPPLTVDAAYSLAAQHFNAGCYSDAKKLCNAIIQAIPNHVDAAHILTMITLKQGIDMHQSGQRDGAIHCYRKTLETQPENITALSNLGSLSRGEEAIECYKKVVAIKPDHAEAHYNLGNALDNQGMLNAAIASYKKAISLQADYPKALSNLGVSLNNLGKFDAAIECYKKAIALKPDYAKALDNLGSALKNQGNFDAAVIYHKQAIAINPDHPGSYNNLGNALKGQCKFSAAISSYKQAIALKADYTEAISNLLLCSQYIPNQSMENLLSIHTDPAHDFANHIDSSIFTHDNSPDPKRKLRIGLVSPDLGRHPVGYFMDGLLKHRSKNDLAIICYSDRLPDDLSKQLEMDADGWVLTKSMEDVLLAQRIHSDRIDILIDLAGHTANNRLSMFARKPAPIQITWAGYVGTTGLKTMDWLIADEHYITANEEKFYTERIIKLPDSWACYTPPDYAPPARKNASKNIEQRFILGNFGNPVKINQLMLETWAQILIKVPQAHLLLIYKGMDNPSNITRINSFFTNIGVDPKRISIEGQIPHRELLERYNYLDLALDTLPYSGGLTTMEALWMGTPVVTTYGKTFASRHSASILRTTGLAELVTEDLDAYIKLVTDLAANPKQLQKLQDGLRSKVQNSPLCDYKKFATDLTLDFRKIWQEWCGKK
jgi:protein O-GlcNAc transferase